MQLINCSLRQALVQVPPVDQVEFSSMFCLNALSLETPLCLKVETFSTVIFPFLTLKPLKVWSKLCCCSAFVFCVTRYVNRLPTFRCEEGWTEAAAGLPLHLFWLGSSRCAAAVADLLPAVCQESRSPLRVCAASRLAGVPALLTFTAQQAWR